MPQNFSARRNVSTPFLKDPQEVRLRKQDKLWILKGRLMP